MTEAPPNGERRDPALGLAPLLAFVAARMPAADPAITGYRAALLEVHAVLARGAVPRIAPTERERTARALAGFAGFLHREILPETIAHGHAAAEAQIRAAIDSAMGAATALLGAQARHDPDPTALDLGR